MLSECHVGFVVSSILHLLTTKPSASNASIRSRRPRRRNKGYVHTNPSHFRNFLSTLSVHVDPALHPPLLITPATFSPLKHDDDTKSANENPKQADRYPATELEWMATTSFNRAVDYYLSENDAKCKQWAEKAMTVAQWLEDDGQLRDLLMGKFSTLQFDK